MIAVRTLAAFVAVLGAAMAAAPALPNLQPSGPAPGVGNISDYSVSSLQDVQVRDGMLHLDALKAKDPVYALGRNKAFDNVQATMQFMMEPAGTKREFGIVFGSTDAGTYHAVSFDRTSVVLYEYRQGQPPKELSRRAGFTKPDGQWYETKVETSGTQVKIFVDGKFVFAYSSPRLKPGHVGFYATGGRAWVRKMELGGTPTAAQLPQIWGRR